MVKLYTLIKKFFYYLDNAKFDFCNQCHTLNILFTENQYMNVRWICNKCREENNLKTNKS